MAKRKAKNKKFASSPKFEKKEEDTFRDQDVDRRSAAIRAIRDVEIDHLLTELRLLRSNFNKQQRQTPVLQFFTENLPNLSLVKNGKGQYEVQWKDKGGTLPRSQGDGIDIHASLLHQMSAAYPDRSSTAIPSFGGFEFSSQAVTASLLGADNLQIKDFGNRVWKDFNIKKEGQWDLFPSCSEGFPGSDFNNPPTSKKLKIGLIVGVFVPVGVVSCLSVPYAILLGSTIKEATQEER